MNRQVKCEWSKPARTHRTHLRGPGERSRGRSSSSAGQVLSVGQQRAVSKHVYHNVYSWGGGKLFTGDDDSSITEQT